jgi:uncharacterized SAM-binding protein YcdF (DUF218 family)
MSFLRGLIATLISPLGLALVCSVVSLLGLLWSSRTRRGSGRRVSWALGFLGLCWLWVWSTPVVSQALVHQLQSSAGPRLVADVAFAPVAVVLGGAALGAGGTQHPYPELGSAADRIWHAARLYRAGKAPVLLLSGGSHRPQHETEAMAMKALLMDLGVPESALWLETRSLTTGQNARFSAEILRHRGVDTVILVTSAMHMRRAQAEFERAGLKVHPAPTDFESAGLQATARDWLPSAEALDASGRAFKEWVGYLALGW